MLYIKTNWLLVSLLATVGISSSANAAEADIFTEALTTGTI